jgi:hypothetical protein
MVTLIGSLEDKFESKRIIKYRKKACIGIRDGNFEEVDAILDFFESIGMLLEKGVLDKEMVWSSFAYCIDSYFYICKDYIIIQQNDNPQT